MAKNIKGGETVPGHYGKNQSCRIDKTMLK